MFILYVFMQELMANVLHLWTVTIWEVFAWIGAMDGPPGVGFMVSEELMGFLPPTQLFLDRL